MAENYTALPALLPVKLETALVAWLRAKRGALLPGVSIAGAHEPTPPAVPWLVVHSTGARTHPDFAGVTGTGHPKIATVDFTLRVHKSIDFYQTASRWAADIQALLAGVNEDFAALLADLNPGGAHHPADGLFIYGIADAEDSLSYNSTARLVMFGLEFTAQSGDPSAE